MPIDYKLSKVVISGFRGVDKLELEFRDGFPSVLIGANNAGKSTVLNAIALALNGGGSHQWSFTESDFFCDQKGQRTNTFLIQVLFRSAHEDGYPAVKGIGKPILIHGVQAKGTIRKNGSIAISRTLLDATGKPVTISTRTPLSEAEKKKWAEHDVGYQVFNARLDDIYEHVPEVLLFKPQNIEASLYIWKTGPIAKLSKLLATKFLSEEWTMKREDGNTSKMPATLHKAYDFFRQAVEAFPFWKDDMKPRLERIFGRYVGSQALIDLRPDTQTQEQWLTQQLAVALASDPNGVATPLRSMGDGWQSVIRLAALEALTEYPDLLRERVVLLLEEPETHLHPHLRRKIRKVLAELSAKGWTVVYTTHSSELVSFDANQVITRMARNNGVVSSKNVDTDKIDAAAKLQSKLDGQGAHDFLFANRAIFCEGRDDRFALNLGLEKGGIDCDARTVSVTQCGSVTAIPAFSQIASALGIPWCAVTDQDLEPDGKTVKPNTERARKIIDKALSKEDRQVLWAVDLEHCFSIKEGKATPETVLPLLSDTEWMTKFPSLASAFKDVAAWIDSTIKFGA